MSSQTDIDAAAQALREGKLVAFPTETVYGLGADATNGEAVARVYAAKGRPSFNPLIAHVPDAQAAFALGDFSPEAMALAEAFWPGPLSLVVPRASGCPVSLLASSGLGSIAIRVPSHPVALALLKAFGRPVVAPSANPSGKISPTTADHVRRHLKGKAAAVLDGGRCKVGVESTVVSFLADGPRLLRHGGVPRVEIETVLGHAIAVESHSARPHAPGQLLSHYAPHAELRLNAQAPRDGEAYLGFGRLHAHGPWTLSATGDLVEAAASLFRLLHEIDATGAARIAVAPIPHQGLGEAINDRLMRAAAPRGPHE
ncbi:L-threonylcarbamoyladenylate synthase [Aestuariivirga sp.]|uniref:L-threonylcarbamoyladenylate synthase n=1 Tax=Aestuariivirga sp. TaxID=2650926 RepID=UPI0025BEB9C8|nr:L-threonylcarbamoyladenylate synthase [Aestuariivirga sp.]